MSEKPDLAFRCAKCEKHVAGIEHGNYTSAEDPQGSAHSRITLVSCPNCLAPCVMQHDYYEEYGEGGWYGGRVLLPQASNRLGDSVPAIVSKSYEEATRVFNDASGYVSAAIMCRRTLEAICEHFGAEGRSLATKLRHLRDKGTIEPRLYAWADQILRNLGNEAAHSVKQDVTRDDARDALDFTRAVIEYLYVFEAAYQTFQQRRMEAGKP